MASEHWIHTDELTEAILALEMALEQAKRVSENTCFWKWAIIALHNSLQGFMVCALRGTNNLNVIKERYAKKWLEAYESGQPLPPREFIDSFLNLYKKIQDNRMLMYTVSRKFIPSGQQDRSVKKLNQLRNKFIHFTPKGWSLEVSGLPQIGIDCVNVIRFLAFESENILWTDESFRLRLESATTDLTVVLEELREKYSA
jgi:hypothetical protein